MKFRDHVLEHLSRHKLDILGIDEDGIFRHMGKDLPKAHILPLEHREKNILDSYRGQFFSSDHSGIDFHHGFHHLNSSQALCINFFYPLIVENALGLFLEYLGVAAGSEIRSLFEKESDIEQAATRTSFDFYLENGVASRIFVEVKYTEDGFASAKNDEKHRDKFQTIYLPLLLEKERFLLPVCQDEQLFLRHYQILRNLVHIGENDRVVLLFPHANTKVSEQAIYARDHFLTDAGRERLKIVYLEEAVPFLERECANSVLEGYYELFRAKYLPV